MVSADNLHLDVLELIFDNLTGNDLPSVALVSRSFLTAVIPRLYQTISYSLRQSKGYETKETMSPFAAILEHPELAVHVRNIELRSVPTIKSKISPPFMQQCRDTLRLCKNLTSFTCAISATSILPVFLPCLQDKTRLENLHVYSNLTTHQSEMLLKNMSLKNLVVEFSSWNLVHVLPTWAESLSQTLSSLTLFMVNELHEENLKATLSHLPNLRGLHVVGCPKVDHTAVLRQVSQTPLLESLAMTTSENTRPLTLPPPLLRHLKHLAFDTRYSLQPSPSPSILSSILQHIRLSGPPLQSFAIKLPERKVIVGEPFVTQLIDSHRFTLRRLSFRDCGLSHESLEAICKSCIHLEQLDLSIPVKEILPFTRRIAVSKTLRTLVDLDSHVDHGIRPQLTPDNARYIMTVSGSVREIITTHRIWTGRVEPNGIVGVDFQKRRPNPPDNLWFMPRE
ncbi:hypothetical protein CPB83DRAFT_918574 [Crepidotus variabilis]|uniref:F-box domain-containing protein n=1 Tax=Crepidotus variabilis TaxID=179855 RepID=A0A9P6JRP4_9AGAR|nr:hypothetical protein CPB83DRAFT_918574 [Crepidotus variabilis]